MQSKENINRRKFINLAATAAAISIVPRHVLGGPGYIPPSDKLTVANIGCGTQGLREMGELLTDPRIQVVSVCDPNTFSMDYLDWSPNGLINGMRRVLGDKSFGKDIDGIPGGREIGQAYVEKYYSKDKASGDYKGCKAYEDFRELLAQEKDLDVVKIMTPDHLHAPIAIAAMKNGVNVVTHKPIANRIKEGKKTIDTARETKTMTNLLAWFERPEYDMIFKWIKDGVIGELKEIHNWSFRPVWPQWDRRPTGTPPIPDGFNWDLWLGPVPDQPYHPNYTHNVFRGWYDFGGGSIADMGHYSLFPLFITMGIDRAPTSAKAYGTVSSTSVDGVCQRINNDVAFPYSSMIQLRFPEQTALPAFDLYWYDGGMKPFAPAEMEAAGREIAPEGLMFVGTKGKIVGGFHGQEPEVFLTGQAKAAGVEKMPRIDEDDRKQGIWVESMLKGEDPPGSFLHAGTITEALNLAAVALRANKRVEYDSENTKITNDKEANKYLSREYRKGWEI